MDDPTISIGFEFDKFSEFLRGRIREDADVNSITKEKEFTEFKKSIQDGRLKSASLPSYFIMTINMNSPKEGVTEERRTFVTILMRSFFSSIIFCQELPGYFKDKVVAECGTSGYDYVKTGNESAVIWRKEDFHADTSGLKPTDTWIINVRDSLRLPDASELLSRIAMVKLTPKNSSKESVLAVSWHGHYKVKDDIKLRELKSLNTFLAEVIKEKGISSYIIGGDFNLNTLGMELPNDVAVASYELSPRQKTQQQKPSKYIPFKDNFVFYPCTKLGVSYTRPFLFEDEETTTSDFTKDDKEKVKKVMENATDTPANPTDMLDHDPIIGVIQFTASTAVQNLS